MKKIIVRISLSLTVILILFFDYAVYLNQRPSGPRGWYGFTSEREYKGDVVGKYMYVYSDSLNTSIIQLDNMPLDKDSARRTSRYPIALYVIGDSEKIEYISRYKAIQGKYKLVQDRKSSDDNWFIFFNN